MLGEVRGGKGEGCHKLVRSDPSYLHQGHINVCGPHHAHFNLVNRYIAKTEQDSWVELNLIFRASDSLATHDAL
jgi:hypothetical protein